MRSPWPKISGAVLISRNPNRRIPKTWLCCTLRGNPTATQSQTPVLNPEFPTYGKLLREAGYRTPYFGKWHVSLKMKDEPGHGLEPYGFTSHTYPDQPGYNLQGTIGNLPDYPNDENTSRHAANWLRLHAREAQPWCLTVGYVNPHDKQFFWGGTEFETYNELYLHGTNPRGFVPASYFAVTNEGPGAPRVPWMLDVLKNPVHHGFAPLPPNWESAKQSRVSGVGQPARSELLTPTPPATASGRRLCGQRSQWSGRNLNKVILGNLSLEPANQ